MEWGNPYPHVSCVWWRSFSSIPSVPMTRTFISMLGSSSGGTFPLVITPNNGVGTQPFTLYDRDTFSFGMLSIGMPCVSASTPLLFLNINNVNGKLFYPLPRLSIWKGAYPCIDSIGGKKIFSNF
jgi:hypothetical protein